MIELLPFTKASLNTWMDHALALESTSGLPAWSAHELSYNLPDKWVFSHWFMAAEKATPIGYAIISRKSPESLHLHRFIAYPTNQGYGSAALAALLAVLSSHARYITLKSAPSETRTQAFYARHGFSPLCMCEGDWLFVRPL